MFKKILIANRGEIALRIIRACRELEIKSVAVHSEVDRDSLFVKLADESYCIGPHNSNKSYLYIPHILSVARLAGVDAIHPGYGFLSENHNFAQICHEYGIVFIGPKVKNILEMGDKNMARKIMKKSGVPLVPGSDDIVKDLKTAKAIANEVGYPVLIKAAYGGGGKGMRVVHNEKELAMAIRMASSEAEAAFSDGSVYIEKYIVNPKHIEVQILADKKGRVIHLGERECTIQRRHQKLIEESPSPFVDDELREKLGDIAVKVARAIKYENAGTVEFVVDKAKNFYFIEMNTRLQVEHPVTESVTGVDLVKEQIRIASGESISFVPRDRFLRGHAIECRINAENPEKNFMPSCGTLKKFILPGGPWIRVDTHVHEGAEISPYYDSMIAKLISWGKDREESRIRMIRALEEFTIEGIKTTIPLHIKILSESEFMKGTFSTNYIIEKSDYLNITG
ncbi:acetyl-CoA carboxylase biotin carboxylase subunit [bacterium]|nr:acetyl-CoA carboxylase biotin carboxylase subunit [bacterium]